MEQSDLTLKNLKEWVRKIKRAGLSTPAILALETHKPLSFILSQLLLTVQPMLDTFLPKQFSGTAMTLFSDRKRLDWFISELEEK